MQEAEIQKQSREMLVISQILEHFAYDGRFLVTVGECAKLWGEWQAGGMQDVVKEGALSIKMVDVMTVLLTRIVNGAQALTFKGGV